MADRSQSISSEKTPVKQFAEEKWRLKEEVALLSTPGWRRGEAPSRSLSKDPLQLREYLKELSSALIDSQRAELYNRSDGDTNNQQPAETQTSFILPQSRGIQERDRGVNISQEVFSGLQAFAGKKIRKLNISVPIEIHSEEERWPSEIGVDAVAQGEHLVDSELLNGLEDELCIPTEAEPMHDLESDRFSDPSLYDQEGQNAPSSSSIDETKHAASLSSSVLRSIAISSLNKGQFTLGREAALRLKEVASSLSLLLARDLSVVSKENNSAVIDRSTLLDVFDSFGVIDSDIVGNQDLFKLCKSYLPLEALNSLEYSLFNS